MGENSLVCVRAKKTFFCGEKVHPNNIVTEKAHPQDGNVGEKTPKNCVVFRKSSTPGLWCCRKSSIPGLLFVGKVHPIGCGIVGKVTQMMVALQGKPTHRDVVAGKAHHKD